MTKIFLGLALVLVVSGCAPRGETLTMEQVLELSQKRMEAAELTLNGSLPKNVSDLKDFLAKALSESNNNKILTQVGDTLATLIPHAAITSRAALNELAVQFKELGARGNTTQDQVTLLVSRTYHAVASELETTRFAL